MTVWPGATGAASCVRAPFQTTVPAAVDTGYASANFNAGSHAGERRAEAVPEDGLPGGVDPVVAEVHRAVPIAARKILDPDGHARGHQHRDRRGRLREHRRAELERLRGRHHDGLVERLHALAAEPGHAFLHEIPTERVGAR